MLCEPENLSIIASMTDNPSRTFYDLLGQNVAALPMEEQTKRPLPRYIETTAHFLPVQKIKALQAYVDTMNALTAPDKQKYASWMLSDSRKLVDSLMSQQVALLSPAPLLSQVEEVIRNHLKERELE